MIIAHKDFDGFCSAGILILAELDRLDDLKYATVGYINKMLKRLAKHEKPQKIFLLDINADNSQLFVKRLSDLINKGFEITLIDHHNFAFDSQLRASGIEVIRNTNICCTQLVYEYFKDRIDPTNIKKADFLLCVGANDDRMITPFVEKKMKRMRTETLFDIFACLMSGLQNGNDFLSNIIFERDKNGVGFTKKLFENAANRRFFLEKIKKQTLHNQEVIKNIRMVHVYSSYIGIAASYLIEQADTDFAIAVGDGIGNVTIRIKEFIKNLFKRNFEVYRKIRVSFRTKKPVNEIVSKIARKYNGHGGGHALACGANIPIEYINDFLREITYIFLKMK
ncbi:MAG: DHHA1 domain-containing protein [Candidatus Helarchaeota archaeon]